MLKEETLQLTAVEPWYNEERKIHGLDLHWLANIGWGIVSLVYDSEKETWCADTECMCNDEDKEFIQLLLNRFVSQIKIEG